MEKIYNYADPTPIPPGVHRHRRPNGLEKLLSDGVMDHFKLTEAQRASMRRDISESVKALIRKCLHPNPAERPSAADILKDPWMLGWDSVSEFDVLNTIVEEQVHQNHQNRIPIRQFPNNIQ